MHITMSFADGSPARISSINTALRHFRPSFIHIWELKTFWHEKAICEDDVEASSSAPVETARPAELVRRFARFCSDAREQTPRAVGTARHCGAGRLRVSTVLRSCSSTFVCCPHQMKL